MFTWVQVLVWSITVVILARTTLRAIGVIVLYLRPEEEAKTDG